MRNLAIHAASRRTRTSCSVLALATVFIVGPTPASAQSFLGVGTPTNGAATTIANGAGTTTITVSAPQTVINWVPTDNATNNNVPIQFQNSNTTANFLGNGNFAVLNNIVANDPSRAISLNGIINAGALGAGAAANGSIYFYAPSGLVLGGSSSINVGSLVLSTSPIFVDGSGNFINGASNQVIFGQAPRATAAITTNTTSTINAIAGDAYVAMVAPRVVHGGTITVNGSAALVGAEAATINFAPSGLFDIQVTTGSTDSQGVVNTGKITGAVSTGAADIHRAYLVAVPKNTALTMLIGAGSNLGFNVAGAANVVGNTVVLSAGHDISGGVIGAPSSGTSGGALANIQVNDSNFTSALVGEATGFAHLAAFNPVHFYSDVRIHADGDIWFSTQAAAGTIDVTGNLSLSTERYAAFGQSMTTSKIDVYNVNGGGRITVNGATSLTSTAHGGYSFTDNVAAGNATAGRLLVDAAAGGAINLLGGLTATADAYGGGGSAALANGGIATGGNIQIETTGNNSALTITGGAALSATGYGGSGNGGECFVCTGNGGDGHGGDINIVSGNAGGSTLGITGNLSAVASGFGGSATAATATAGDGFGGKAAFYVGTGNNLSLTGNLLLKAEGTGGFHSTGNGGMGMGGRADITEEIGATSGTIVINGNVELSSDGHGGASSGSGTRGGDGFGGGGTDNAYIYAQDASITVNGSANLHSVGFGGAASNGIGGDGFGGEAYVESRKSLTITGPLTINADATGGNGRIGGDGYGGDLFLTARSGGTLTLSDSGTKTLSALATGGVGSNGHGGSGYGGNISISARDAASKLNVTGSLSALAGGTGGTGSGLGISGFGDGGRVKAFASLGGAVSIAGLLRLNADGRGAAG
ncbi:MAG: hypothetical protein ABIR87_02885, partial [Sphingomicrobium sp.]